MSGEPRQAVRASAVEIVAEDDGDAGWTHQALLRWTDGEQTRHRLRLSWADHDHLSGGAVSPSRTAAAALAVAAACLGREELPGRTDASTLRRMVEGFDALVRDRLGGA